MAVKTTAQLKSLVRGARFSRQEEKALMDILNNSANGAQGVASPAGAAGTDATIIDEIVAQLEAYGVFTG